MAAQRPNRCGCASMCSPFAFPRTLTYHWHQRCYTHSVGRSMNEYVLCVEHANRKRCYSFTVCVVNVNRECIHLSDDPFACDFILFYYIIRSPYSSRHFLFASQNHSPFVRQYTTRFSFIEAQVSWISICQEVRLLRLNFGLKQHSLFFSNS